MAQALKKSSTVMDAERAADVEALAVRVFGRPPKRVAFPGGTSRSAFAVDMGDAKFVFAHRDDNEDAQLEAIALNTLGTTGLVPKLQARFDNWVVQEYLEGIRLPILIDETASQIERAGLVSKALDSLVNIHKCAHDANLHHRVPKVGTADKWLWNRTGVAKRISKSIGIIEPNLDREKLVKLMDVKRDEFVKWDARPGNAMMVDGAVVWFDWEECRRSKALDDLCFVLCDEWTAISHDHILALVKRYFPFFNKSLSPEQGEHYLHLFAVTHCLLRLRMALKLRLRDGKWWDRDYCLQGDKIGVTPQEASRTIARARLWADGVEEFRSIGSWLDGVSEHFDLEP